jgi:hypothetical protein
VIGQSVTAPNGVQVRRVCGAPARRLAPASLSRRVGAAPFPIASMQARMRGTSCPSYNLWIARRMEGMMVELLAQMVLIYSFILGLDYLIVES